MYGSITLLGVFGIMFMLSIYEQRPVSKGQDIYENKCIRCHGPDGTRGLLGAKNLQQSLLQDSAITLIVLRGKKFMPAYKSKLTAKEIEDVTFYVKSLRK